MTDVPIKPVLASWTKNKQKLSRFQLPLNLSWATSTFKSQGSGLNKAVVDVSGSDYTMGLTFVGFSRVSNRKSLAVSNSM